MMSTNAEAVLAQIESNDDCFTTGRRNDDVVNWALCHIMLDTDIVDACKKFNEIKLTRNQKVALWAWDLEPEDKIDMIYNYYANKSDKFILSNVWIRVQGYDKPQIIKEK
jgi:hypothetical protein